MGTHGGLSTVAPWLPSVSQSFAAARCSRRDVCVLVPGEVSVLLQLQDVLQECGCSCSAHVQLFLTPLLHSCGLPASPHIQK